MQTTHFLELPGHFSFKSTIYSHGWCGLPPFSLDEENWMLTRVFGGGNGTQPVTATLSEEEGKLKVQIAGGVEFSDSLARDIRHVLRLDDDLTGLYRAIEKKPGLEWVAEKRAGRLLRSPTVFEDLVKTICTTNCSWALTVNMVTNLVQKLGAEPPASAGGQFAGPDDSPAKTCRAFPTAEAMAAVNADFYRNEIKAGYRSPYFVELAEAVASGKLDPESWLTSELPTAELKKAMKKVKGVGDYAAENLLKLVGRYDGLALDSWLRSQFYKKHNSEKPCDDKKIHRHYEKYGPWRGLVIWCDMTEKWLVE